MSSSTFSLIAFFAIVSSSVLVTGALGVTIQLDKHLKQKHDTVPSATPMPTFPPPQFHGYIILAQYECMDLLCPDWSLTVTRLATECFTWNCTHEEKIEVTLFPKSPWAKANFSVYTSYHSATRRYYVVGITDAYDGIGKIWTVQVSEDFKTFSLVNSTQFTFPNDMLTFASLEVNSVSGAALGIYEDGTLAEINSVSGVSTVVGNALNNGTLMATQATHVDETNNLLFVNYNDGFGSGVGFTTVSLKNYSVLSSVLLGPLPYNQGSIPTVFALNWVPEVGSLVVFATGTWDQLIYVNPWTGNTSYAIFEIDEIMDKIQFCVQENVRVCDTCKNTAYDRNSKKLYFQATHGDCITGTTELIMTPPFATGAPTTIYYLDVALSPMDFGYQGMHWASCYPNCPT